MPIAVVGMLDEREEALRIIKDRIEQRGHKALLIDITVTAPHLLAPWRTRCHRR
jgi:hypothetical protein